MAFDRKMKTNSLLILMNGALLAVAPAQMRNRALEVDPDQLVRPEEARAVQEQTVQLFDAISPAAHGAVESTVWVWANTGRNNRPVGFGTVIGDGTRVLTKWSEIAMARSGIVQIVGGDGTTAKATVLGVYQDEDLAVLQIEGTHFKPVEFSRQDAPKLGRFLIAASPDDTPASVGVVAVEARSLRETDQAFLGVLLDASYKGEGVRIQEVQPDSAALEAGLKGGDVILSLAGRKVGSRFEVQNALNGRGPGERIDVVYLRNKAQATAVAELKAKKEDLPQFPNGRLRVMERMGTELSLVRSGFPSAIQTDMQLDRGRCGGPVVDLDGKVIGIAIARADRTRSFIIPAAHIVDLLTKDPVSREVAEEKMNQDEQAERQQVGQRMPRGQKAPRQVPIEPGSADRLRRHLADMDRLIERMREEMEDIDE